MAITHPLVSLSVRPSVRLSLSACLSLAPGPSAGYDRQHPVRQLRPQDQLHHRCVWDESRWAEEGKLVRWPPSSPIHPLSNPEPVKTQLAHIKVRFITCRKERERERKKKNLEFGQCVILNDLSIICAKEQNPVNVGHMSERAKTLPWALRVEKKCLNSKPLPSVKHSGAVAAMWDQQGWQDSAE